MKKHLNPRTGTGHGGMTGYLHMPTAGKLKAFIIPTAILSLIILFFSARSRMRDDSLSNHKSGGKADKKVLNGKMGEEFPQKTKIAIRQPPSLESNSGTKPRQLNWAQLDAKRKEYDTHFSPELASGSGRAVWRNSKEVRFWTDLLASDNPELVQQAISILEGATSETAGAVLKSKGSKASDRRGYSREEWESAKVYSFMMGARGLMSGARNSLPREESFNGGDLNDSLLLKDARTILDAFMPRLRAPDPSKAAAAKSVMNFFTFDIFREESSDWWEAGSPLDEAK